MASAVRKTVNKVDKPVSHGPTGKELDPAIQSIIDKGRRSQGNRVQLQSSLGTIVLPACTVPLLWACFTPLSLSALAWVAIVPLCLLIRSPTRPQRMYLAAYAGGFLWSVATFQWMRLGHPTMYGALIAWSIYMAFYFPLFIGLSRVAVHRLRVPLILAVPIVWTGLEYAKAYILTGCSWYYLGHSQYRWIELIQVSDLVGAYGVSFVVAMANAAVAVTIPASLLQRLQLEPEQPAQRPWVRPIAAIGLSLTVLCATVAYGYSRRAEANFTTGPRIALIQGNFDSQVKHDPKRATDIIRTHDQLTAAAMLYGSRQPNPPARPEIIVWPETMLPWPMQQVADGVTDNDLKKLLPTGSRASHEDWIARWRDEDTAKRLANDATTMNAAMLIGVPHLMATKERIEQRNSVAFVTPQLGMQGRYDKNHLLIFGEYIPLKEYLPFLSMFTPYGSQHGLEPGKQAAVFQYAGANFAPIICYEDTVPQLVRSVAHAAETSDRPLDFFVNNTNDGWFHGSSELDQHLITASFRCVETRTPMVRAVNTGVSAFIDGDGVIREPDIFLDAERVGKKDARGFLDENGRWTKQVNAALIDNVPLDDRDSAYVRHGDLFAGSCGLMCLLLCGAGFVTRKRTTSQRV